MKLGVGLSPVVSRRMTGAGGPFVNPAHVKLLLHFDTGFVDESQYARTPTLLGGPTVSALQAKFGANSYLSAPGNATTYPASLAFDFSNSIPAQISLRLWSDPARSAGSETFCAVGAWGSGGYLVYVDHATSQIRIATGGVIVRTFTGVTIPTSQWVTMRFNHDGAGNYRAYQDGVLISVQSGATFGYASSPFHVGAYTNGSPIGGVTGYIDEFLFEKHPDLVITTSATYAVETLPYSTSATAVAPPATDPAKAKLRLHFDADFTDSSPSARVASLINTPAVSALQTKFGAKSFLNNRTSSIYFPASADFNVADSIPMQLSCRVWSKATRTGSEVIIGTHNWAGAGYLLYVDNPLGLIRLSSNNAVRYAWTYVLPIETWTALRFNHDGNGTYRLYADGVLIQAADNIPSLSDIAGAFTVGNRQATWDLGLVGYMDEFLFEKDPALVITTANVYTVEAASFPNS